MTTARDVRDAEQVARLNALGLSHGAPPPSVDPLAHAHAMRLARLWRAIAEAHDEYAVELEQRQVAS